MRLAIARDPALIIVDVQRDFMPGGALPVPRGDEIVPILNRLIVEFEVRGFPVVLTRDWHPPDHVSFRERGGPWPPHCVRETEGAEFHPDLILPKDPIVVSKATERDKEAYSGFDGTELDDLLRERGVRRLFVGGVATEYCVRATVLDALKLGYEVVVIEEAVRGIREEDVRRAMREMVERGAIVASINDILWG